MVIKTFHVDGNNRIVVNGTKIMWATLSDIIPYGDDNTPLKERFEQFVADKQNVNTPKKKETIVKEQKTTKKDNKANKKEKSEKRSRWQNRKLIPKNEMLEYLSDSIEELTQFYYNKYKGIALIDIEDVRTEVIIFLYEMYDLFLGGPFELYNTNKKSFIYMARNKYEDRLIKRLNGYVYKLSIKNDINEELFKLSDTHMKVCSFNDNVYTSSDVIKQVELEYTAKSELHPELSKDMAKIYERIITGEIKETIAVVDMEEEVMQSELKRCIEDVIGDLTPREVKVIGLRFGFEDGKMHTLEEVANILKVQRERIRQIEAKALRKLRHPSRSYLVKDFAYEDRIVENRHKESKTDLHMKAIRNADKKGILNYQPMEWTIYNLAENYTISNEIVKFNDNELIIGYTIISDSKLKYVVSEQSLKTLIQCDKIINAEDYQEDKCEKVESDNFNIIYVREIQNSIEQLACN